MPISEELFIHLVYEWLAWRDLIQLYNASSRRLHTFILTFLQSAEFRRKFQHPQFNFAFNNPKSFDESSFGLFNRLEWFRARQVSLKDGIVYLTSENFKPEYHDRLQVTTGTYEFIREAYVDISNPVDFHLLCSALVSKFPRVQALTCTGKLNSLENTIALVANLLPTLQLKRICLNLSPTSSGEEHLVHSLEGLYPALEASGAQIEHFSLHKDFQISPSFLHSLTSYCPNMKNLLPNSALHTSVPFPTYSPCVTKLIKLEKLDLNIDHWDLSDDDLKFVFSSLPCLKEVVITGGRLTVQSALTLLTRAKEIKYIALGGFQWKRTIVKAFYDHPTSQLTLEAITEAGWVSPYWSEFLRSIPTLTSLHIHHEFPATSMQILCTLIKGNGNIVIKDLKVCTKAFYGGIVHISVMFELFSALQSLNIIEDDDFYYYQTEDWEIILSCLCQNCPDMQVLQLHSTASVHNDQVLEIAQQCQKLTSLKLTGDCGFLSPELLWGLTLLDRIWESLELMGTAIKGIDILKAIAGQGLKVKKIVYFDAYDLHSIGRGRVLVRGQDIVLDNVMQEEEEEEDGEEGVEEDRDDSSDEGDDDRSSSDTES